MLTLPALSDTLFFTDDIYNEKQDKVFAFKEQGQAEKNQVNKQDFTGGKSYRGRKQWFHEQWQGTSLDEPVRGGSKDLKGNQAKIKNKYSWARAMASPLSNHFPGIAAVWVFMLTDHVLGAHKHAWFYSFPPSTSFLFYKNKTFLCIPRQLCWFYSELPHPH